MGVRPLHVVAGVPHGAFTDGVLSSHHVEACVARRRVRHVWRRVLRRVSAAARTVVVGNAIVVGIREERCRYLVQVVPPRAGHPPPCDHALRRPGDAADIRGHGDQARVALAGAWSRSLLAYVVCGADASALRRPGVRTRDRVRRASTPPELERMTARARRARSAALRERT
jgi:hypothetical protein